SVVRLEESWAAGPWPRSPEPFLELQFPIWAGRFTQFYHLPSLFEEPNRGSLLKSAVLARINGESAMALDRRGLEHIFPDIAAGDAIRRELQDGLFSLVPITNPDEPQRQITHYRDLYETALRHITLYHQSRALVERMAAEVPYYAEWEILASARQAPAEIQDGPLPSIVDEVLAHSARLLLALEGHDSDSPEAYFDNLELKHREAESRFHKIRDHYLGRANNVVSNVTRQVNLEFRELDELLTTPLLPPDQRRKILERVVSLDRIGPSLTPPSDADLTPRPKEGPSADPGFFRRALGLAALDTRLLNLGLAPGEPLPVESVDRALQALTELQTATPDYASGSTARNFATLSRELSDRTRLPSTASSVSVLTKLQNAERASRFAGVGREANLDDPVGRLEQYALRRALERHAERLALDYAPANQVSALYQEAANLFPDEDVEPLSHPLYRGVLEPLCSPDDDPLRI
ncbi:MAG TPA: hypothetical protein VFT74_19105, partial [Isosphaeraceae bacterium]|nr:hypothetical protein [Isosphaeraceae bacterium]